MGGGTSPHHPPVWFSALSTSLNSVRNVSDAAAMWWAVLGTRNRKIHTDKGKEWEGVKRNEADW